MKLPDKMPPEIEKEFKVKIKEILDKCEKEGYIKRQKEPRVRIDLELMPNKETKNIDVEGTIKEIWR